MAPSTLRIGAALSLTGRFARFGSQAATGLRVWSAMTGAPEPVIVDDGGDPGRVGPALDELAGRCDLLLGPYGTSTTRAAAAWARGSGRLLWNHGGAGEDVQAAAPGRMISVLSPTGRYAEPFVAHLAEHHPGLPLRLVAGPGSFGATVVGGARAAAGRHGVRIAGGDGSGGPVAVFTAGTFEHDTAVVRGLLAGPRRPAVIGTVAAGVRDFATEVPDPDGVLGIAQWLPGAGADAAVGPAEAGFLRAYRAEAGREPDYPGVQAAAAAAIAVHCAGRACSTSAGALRGAATSLRTSTLYGAFAADPETGTQVGHRVALARWEGGRLVRMP